MIIGIAGGSGSGKTTLTKALIERFREQVAVLYHDNYYKRHTNLPFEERCRLNYDQPEAFDTELLLEDLRLLAAGHEIQSPLYDYTQHNRSEKTQLIKPKPLILVEGILLFAEPELCGLFDLKIFVDTDADVRILRRLRRDMLERGRSFESVERQYLTSVKPMHELYVEPSKHRADIIVPEGGHNLVALDLLVRRMEAALEGGKNE